MRVLFVHPSCLMYSEVYLRLEPLGLELVAASAREAGYTVRLLDLQAAGHPDYFRLLDEWRPDAVAFSLNYLANVPEVIDLSIETRRRLPECFIFVGGHSASFITQELLAHAGEGIDCVVRGEGEAITPQLLAQAETDRSTLHTLPGVVTATASGPAPRFVDSLDRYIPARDLLPNRHKYFIGTLDPCASIEFTRGCPWDCSFCSAWTFYGRSYRQLPPERAAEELARIQEPNVFIVDDVAFIHPESGMAIGQEIERLGIQKEYYLETRGDVLLRNKEVFQYWKRLGLHYMFLGLEAIDEEGLKLHRKRVSLGENFKALEFARSLDITVAINIIADPDWDEKRFGVIREWAMSIPEIVHITVNTPYPGTETWLTESRSLATRDYRLFDVQHAVLPTKLPLEKFYQELVRTQQVLNKKHMGFAALRDTFFLMCKLLARGQTNFARMLWKFNSVYNPERQVADHQKEVRYAMSLPQQAPVGKLDRRSLYIHQPERVHATA